MRCTLTCSFKILPTSVLAILGLISNKPSNTFHFLHTSLTFPDTHLPHTRSSKRVQKCCRHMMGVSVCVC
uniref:Putative secreted peptide n=1 Tax=Anopheles braziliensis TaxID=58242 RepID=A0A2M3ZX38_9DIPT